MEQIPRGAEVRWPQFSLEGEIRRLSSFQPCNLFQMVAGMDPVKLAPLLGSQRAKNEVVGELTMRAEAALALRHNPVHVRDVNRQIA